MSLITRKNPNSFMDNSLLGMDNIFENIFGHSGMLLDRFNPSFSHMGIERSDDEEGNRIIQVALPGVSAEDVQLNVQNNHLRWEVEMDSTTERGKFVSHKSGSYYLTDDLDLESIEADLTNGVLSVTIPYKEKTEAKNIEITTSKNSALEEQQAISIEEKTKKPD